MSEREHEQAHLQSPRRDDESMQVELADMRCALEQAGVLARTAGEALKQARRQADEAQAAYEALLGTKTFRYTAPLRRLYGRLRATSRRFRPVETSSRSEQLPLTTEPFVERRTELAARFIHGSGIEIGPLNEPLALPPETQVRYVDRLSRDDLREHYPELAHLPLVEADVIDDGERLFSFADASVDFVVANHFLEHCENPIGTVANHLRVLRDGGVLFFALPDKRYTFDAPRPVTSLDHVIRDYENGPGWSQQGHFVEWARLVDHADVPEERAQELLARDYSIHFHVWTPRAFLDLIDYCRDNMQLALELELFARNGHEFIVVLRKSATLP